MIHSNGNPRRRHLRPSRSQSRWPTTYLLASSFFAILLFIGSAHAAETAVDNPKPVCGFGDLRFDAGYPGARINECHQTGRNQFSLGVRPENYPINHSPWYGFRVLSERKRSIDIYLHYGMHRHRYLPKISTDGENWELLSEDRYSLLLDRQAIRFKLRVGPQPVYISAQEIIDNRDYQAWNKSMAELPHVQKSELGRSINRRLLEQLRVQGPGHEWVLIVGRQHPPEVTGAVALFPFVETLVADTDLAKRFRERFNLLIVPNMNPDGVAEGHWRHNMGGVDLNRDWGLFTQPETRLVGAVLDELFENTDQKLVLGLDFHSTNRDVFYTQKDNEVPYLTNFTVDWLTQLESRIPQFKNPGFKIDRAPSSNAGRPVFKHYISETYGIPAITYELGDETNRDLIREVSLAAAEEMMDVLLNN